MAHIKRLTTLADFLEKLPRKAFNLEGWVQDKDTGRLTEYFEDFDLPVFTKNEELKKGIKPETMISCGTTACAVGWAGSIPEFCKAGFRIVSAGAHVTPTYGGSQSWDAVHRFFELTEFEANRLFSMSEYPNDKGTPKQVAKRIRKLIEKSPYQPT
jgi:hypothetical protein